MWGCEARFTNDVGVSRPWVIRLIDPPPPTGSDLYTSASSSSL